MDPLLQHLKGENLNVRSMPTVTDTIQPYYSEKIWETFENILVLLLLNVDSELFLGSHKPTAVT